MKYYKMTDIKEDKYEIQYDNGPLKKVTIPELLNLIKNLIEDNEEKDKDIEHFTTRLESYMKANKYNEDMIKVLRSQIESLEALLKYYKE